MLLRQNHLISWLEFELFQEFKELKHGTIICHDQLHPFIDLNVHPQFSNTPCNKDAESIHQALKLPAGHFLNQVHGNTIISLKTNSPTGNLRGDGWSTKLQKNTLWIKHADCQAVLFYDPIQKVIANIHCGWKGNVLNVLGQMVLHLSQEYGCNPKDIRVGISPSLGPYASEFINFKKEFPDSFWNYQVKAYYFDLWAISYDQLLKEGVLEKNIEIARLCTYENKDLFFSYRRNKTPHRTATFISLL